jgi:hypothetical protein
VARLERNFSFLHYLKDFLKLSYKIKKLFNEVVNFFGLVALLFSDVLFTGTVSLRVSGS